MPKQTSQVVSDSSARSDIQTIRRSGARSGPQSGPQSQVRLLVISCLVMLIGWLVPDRAALAQAAAASQAAPQDPAASAPAASAAPAARPAFEPLEFSELTTQVPSGVRQINFVAFSPNGKFLATANGGWQLDRGTMEVWNLPEQRRVGRSVYSKGVCQVAWTGDGRQLVNSSWNSKIQVLEFPSLKNQTEIRIDQSIARLGISPDGSKIVSAAEGYENSDTSLGRVVQIWDVATGELIRRCGKEANLFRLGCTAWSPSGKYVAAGGGNYSSPLRGEARVWDPETGKDVSRLVGHTQFIRAMRFFPDDTRIATAALDGTIRMWESATGKELAAFNARTPLTGLDISPDGTLLVAAAVNGPVSVWDVSTKTSIGEVDTNGRSFQAVAFSPDGQRIAAGGIDGIVKIWNIAQRKVEYELPAEGSAERPSRTLAFAPAAGGEFVVVADVQGDLQAIAPATETMLWKLTSRRGQAPTAIAISIDRSRVLVGTEDGQVRLHAAKDGKLLSELKRMPARISTVAFAANGERFAAGDTEGHFWLWDDTRPVPLAEHHDHHGAVLAIGFSAKTGSGTSVAADGSAITWRADNGAKILEKQVRSTPVTVATISRDGSTLFVDSPPAPLGFQQPVWDAVKLTPILTRNLVGPGLGNALLSANGSHLITSHRNYTALMALQQPVPPKIWDSPSNDGRAAIALSPDDRFFYQARAGGFVVRASIPFAKPALGKLARAGNAAAVAVSPDGKWLVSGGDDSQISVWNLASGEMVDVLPAGGGTVYVCCFSHDGRWLATATLSGTVKVWKVADRSLEGSLLQVHPGVRSLAFSPDGRWLASGGTDRALKVTDLKTWETATTQADQPLWVTGLAFSDNGKTLYSATGSWDGKDQPVASDLTAWNVKTDDQSLSLQKSKTVRTHDGTVDNIVLTRDGQRVITAAGDSQIKVWNAETLDLVRTIRTPHSIHRVQLIPNHQNLLAIGGYLGGVSVWDIASGELVATYTGHTSHVFDIAALPDGSGLISAGEDDVLQFWPGPIDSASNPFQPLLKVATPKP